MDSQQCGSKFSVVKKFLSLGGNIVATGRNDEKLDMIKKPIELL